MKKTYIVSVIVEVEAKDDATCDFYAEQAAKEVHVSVLGTNVENGSYSYKTLKHGREWWKQAEVSKALCNDNIQTYGRAAARTDA